MTIPAFRSLLLPVFAACVASSAHAALIISESFDYPIGGTLSNVNGANADANGGTGFSGAWNNSRTDAIVAGLTDARSATPGGGVGGAALVSVNFTGRTWDGTSYGTDANEIWFSTLFTTSGASFNGTGNSRMLVFGSLTSGTGFGFELTTAGNLVARLGGSNSAAVATYTQGQANFVLGRYVNSTSGNDLLQLWVNPTAGELSTFNASGLLADLGTVDSSVAITSEAVTFSTSSAVYLRAQNSATTNWTADELRIGTTFTDVAAIPEPSAAASLAGLAVLGGVMLRRRRRA